MSKFNVGDRVSAKIIKVNEDGTYMLGGAGGMVCFSGKMIASLDPVHGTYEEGVLDGQKEAWKVAKKICSCAEAGELGKEELEKIFGKHNPIEELTAREAVHKLKMYELVGLVGDEIILGSSTGVITNTDGDTVHVLWKKSGTTQSFLKEEFRPQKTGRNFLNELKSLMGSNE